MLSQTSLTLLPNNLQDFKDKWLLLDTDVLIDASQVFFTKSFKTLFLDFKNNGAHLSTISAVVVEFLMGRNIDIRGMNEGREYLTRIIEGMLQIPNDSNEVSQEMVELKLILAYGKAGQQVSYADYMIGRILKKHSKSTYLMTGNHKDFSLSIFDIVQTITIGSSSAKNKIYGIYKFSYSKYEQRLEELLEKAKD